MPKNKISSQQKKKLVDAARNAMKMAYNPYSKNSLGAAVLDHAGHVYSAGNIENCCYALTVCAERAALYQAVSLGVRKIIALAVTSSDEANPVPCGACRQVIWELAGDIPILTFHGEKGSLKTTSLSQLYPNPYKKRSGGRLRKFRK